MLLTEQLPLAETAGMVADCKGKNKQNSLKFWDRQKNLTQKCFFNKAINN